MMFDLLVQSFAERGREVRVFDIAESAGSRCDTTFAWSRVADYLRVLPRLWAHLLCGPSIVYMTTAQSLLGFLRDAAVIWPASLLGRPLLTHQFGGNYREFFGRQNIVMKWFIRLTLSRVNTIIVEGEPVKSQFSFLPRWETQVQAIANGLPQRIDFPLSAKVLPDPTIAPFELLYLSNLVETKGYWDVLEAVRILVKKRKRRIQCTFVGRFLASIDSTRFADAEAAKTAFEEFVKTHELSQVVTHFDGLFGKEKAQAFTRAAVFLLPSNYINEGQPVSVLEAMAHGVPVIATSHRLIPLMVEHGKTGLLVAYNSPGEIADQVEFLMDNPDEFQRMSRESIDRFHRHFSAESYVDKLSLLFDRQCPSI